MLGLLGYGIGALAMALAQGLTAIIVFWAIVGGIGASLLWYCLTIVPRGRVAPLGIPSHYLGHLLFTCKACELSSRQVVRRSGNNLRSRDTAQYAV